ncbi:hypothetical protein D3C84_857170 [compost metagenome]
MRRRHKLRRDANDVTPGYNPVIVRQILDRLQDSVQGIRELTADHLSSQRDLSTHSRVDDPYCGVDRLTSREGSLTVVVDQHVVGNRNQGLASGHIFDDCRMTEERTVVSSKQTTTQCADRVDFVCHFVGDAGPQEVQRVFEDRTSHCDNL